MTAGGRAQRRAQDDRRAPTSRRVGFERRQAERRRTRLSGHAVWGDSNRRHHQRRQVRDRRRTFDRRCRRRRDTPTPYRSEEVERIQRMFATMDVATACPACGGEFSLGPPRKRGADTVRRVACTNCGRATIVANSRRARLLFVEEDQALREGLLPILIGGGHDVVTADDMEQALALFRQHPVDVVIVDVSRPARLDGREFLRVLYSEFPGTAVVALATRTSYGIADPLAAVRQMGATRVLRMPFPPGELLKTVEEVRP